MLLEIRRNFDLELSLFSSFSLPLFEKEGEWWVKRRGAFRELRMRSRGQDALEVENCPDPNVAFILSGAWFDPFEHLEELSEEVREKALLLVERFGDLGLAVNPYDRELIFISVALSANTDFHANTVRWVKRISEGDLRELPGRSFQLKNLPEQLSFYLREIKPVEDSLTPEELRLKLLQGPRIGPKIATSYLLFSRKDATFFAPSDVHFQRAMRKLGMLSWEKPWDPKLCRSFPCSHCPGREECLSFLARKAFGRLAGWMQTASYILEKLYCRRRRCGECGLREICEERA